MEETNNVLTSTLSAIDKIFSGVIITNRQGIVVGYNQAASEYEGIAKKDALGKNIEELYFGNTVDEDFKSKFFTCMESKKPILNIITEYSTSAGSIISVVQNYYPVISCNKVVGSFCILNKSDKLQEAIIVINKIKSDAGIQSQNLGYINFDNIIGKSPQIMQSIGEANKVSQTNVDSLIIGETGTGKELFVRSIHNNSCRNSEPFVPINCATIPENLMESILFGTKKGAFTDSIDSTGLFELAKGGTLFLDELNSMNLLCQTKLLRAIEEKKIRKLGAGKEIDVNCRIIGALNKEPIDCINDGTLKRDLFYRLSVACISIPPLRDRPSDIPILLDEFIKINNKKYNKKIEGVDPSLFELFSRYSWDGNIREFINVIEGMFIQLDDSKILSINHLSNYHYKQISTSKQTNKNIDPGYSNLNDALYAYEKEFIENVLVNCNGNKRQAASLMGISAQSLHYKLKKFAIS